MSELIGCDCCKGRKNIVGLGSMSQQCPRCQGVGWIKKEEISSRIHQEDFAITLDEEPEGIFEELLPIDHPENKAIIKEECRFPGKKRGRPAKEVQKDLIDN